MGGTGTPALNPFDALVALAIIGTAGGVLTRLISTIGEVAIGRAASGSDD